MGDSGGQGIVPLSDVAGFDSVGERGGAGVAARELVCRGGSLASVVPCATSWA